MWDTLRSPGSPQHGQVGGGSCRSQTLGGCLHHAPGFLSKCKREAQGDGEETQRWGCSAARGAIVCECACAPLSSHCAGHPALTHVPEHRRFGKGQRVASRRGRGECGGRVCSARGASVREYRRIALPEGQGRVERCRARFLGQEGEGYCDICPNPASPPCCAAVANARPE